ncbi:Fe-S cluster assembly protein SufD [Arenimonas fontis]|uniref:Fe-S cluster assembly protein SufD n=1 Tax=Arenimonas fontis TaxID=2608255 RepID=A0A5B2ZDD7_9GAMM|nr:Fe-S cluster assembly protein SufD [Arenimonas fontis]KAA2285224.1 Fe-S cluster assembly protein SufD [Arenimonas fontis]
MSALLESLKAGFEALPADRVEALGLGPARRAALADALAAGLPGARVETWKYTSLRALANRSFALARGGKLAADRLAGIPAPRLVFVNGAFDAGASDLSSLPREVELRPFSQVLAEGHPRDAAVLGRRFERTDEPFARFNAALALDGARLAVPAGIAVDAPVHLVFVGAPAGEDQAWHLRHLIELGKGASATVLEHHLATGAHRHLGNHVMHVHLAAGARLRHARRQQEDTGATLLARTDAVLGSDSEYRRVDLELGAGLGRHELNVQLIGEGAALHAGGVLLADGRRHLDTRLGVEHRARDTRCELPWRGLADGRGRAVFHGGITIQAGADGSAAELSSKNLLLSDQAEVDTQPVLVIHADEVKAAHGATVGRLDETALFYLRSRGLPGAEARRLLVQAFLREPLAVLDDSDGREALSAAIERRLLQETPA